MHKVEAYRRVFEDIPSRLLTDPFAAIDDLAPKCEVTTPSTNGLADRLTASGASVIINHSDDLPMLSKIAVGIQDETRCTGFILIKNLPLDEEQFKLLVDHIGQPIEHKFKTGQSDLLKLNATREKGNVVLGRGPLPLHTDGIFVGCRPDLIILYASEFSDVPGSGETFVVDQLAYLKEMPDHLRKLLEEGLFEYRIQEAGHFDLDDQWFPISPIWNDKGEQCLGLALQFPDSIVKSWDVRVAGVPREESDKILAELNDFLTRSRYTYQHRWNVGDLLVIDNSATLHRRTAIGDDGVRVLFRGQVNRRIDGSDNEVQ